MTAVRTPPRPNTAPRGWTLAVAAGCLLTLVAVALDSGVLVPTAIAGAALVALFAAYLVVGRQAFDGGPGWALMAGVICLVGLVGAAADPSFATVQVVAFPLIWTITPNTRRALVCNVGLAVAVGIGYWLSTARPVTALVLEATSLAFSVVLGLWISSIADRSEERRVLLEQLTAAQDELSALHREAGGAAERERLSREIHDTLAQSLTAIVMLAERAGTTHPNDPMLGVLQETAREALAETRGLVAAAAPVSLDGGLATAIDRLADRFQRETGVTVTAVVAAEVPRALEVVLLRCAQEGLANVRKHADARTAQLRIERIDGDVHLVLTDDGRGPASADPDRGFGLAGMRERVALVGGEMTLTPGTRGGAALGVRLPAEPAAAVS